MREDRVPVTAHLDRSIQGQFARSNSFAMRFFEEVFEGCVSILSMLFFVRRVVTEDVALNL